MLGVGRNERTGWHHPRIAISIVMEESKDVVIIRRRSEMLRRKMQVEPKRSRLGLVPRILLALVSITSQVNLAVHKIKADILLIELHLRMNLGCD